VTWRGLVGTWRLIRDWSYLLTFGCSVYLPECGLPGCFLNVYTCACLYVCNIQGDTTQATVYTQAAHTWTSLCLLCVRERERVSEKWEKCWGSEDQTISLLKLLKITGHSSRDYGKTIFGRSNIDTSKLKQKFGMKRKKRFLQKYETYIHFWTGSRDLCFFGGRQCIPIKEACTCVICFIHWCNMTHSCYDTGKIVQHFNVVKHTFLTQTAKHYHATAIMHAKSNNSNTHDNTQCCTATKLPRHTMIHHAMTTHNNAHATTHQQDSHLELRPLSYSSDSIDQKAHYYTRNHSIHTDKMHI